MSIAGQQLQQHGGNALSAARHPHGPPSQAPPPLKAQPPSDPTLPQILSSALPRAVFRGCCLVGRTQRFHRYGILDWSPFPVPGTAERPANLKHLTVMFTRETEARESRKSAQGHGRRLSSPRRCFVPPLRTQGALWKWALFTLRETEPRRSGLRPHGKLCPHRTPLPRPRPGHLLAPSWTG